jgi:hypothetical protein
MKKSTKRLQGRKTHESEFPVSRGGGNQSPGTGGAQAAAAWPRGTEKMSK